MSVVSESYFVHFSIEHNNILIVESSADPAAAPSAGPAAPTIQASSSERSDLPAAKKNKQSAFAGFVKQLSPSQIALLKAKRFEVQGSFWGKDCKPNEKDVWFNCIVLEIITAHKASAGAATKSVVKIGLLHDDDKDFLMPDKIENQHYWLVDFSVFSKIWYAFLEETARRRTLLEESPSTDQASETRASQDSAAALLQPKKMSFTSAVRACFEKCGEYQVVGSSKTGDLLVCTLLPPPPNGHKPIRYVDSTQPLWDYVLAHYPEKHTELKDKKHHTRERHAPNGSDVLLYLSTDPVKRVADYRFLLMLTDNALPLSLGERQSTRDLFAILDPRYQPPLAETLARLNLGLNRVAESRRIAKILDIRSHNQKVGVQIDMLTKGSIQFVTTNFSWVEKGLFNFKGRGIGISFISGDLLLPTLIIKNDVLRFHQYKRDDKTADNLCADLMEDFSALGIALSDIAFLAPDGAANAKKCAELTSQIGVDAGTGPVPHGTCRIHDVGRAVLHATGRQGALTASKNPQTTALVLKFKQLANKFSTSPKLSEKLAEAQKELEVVTALTMESPAVVRWNGIFVTHERANRLKGPIEAALSSAGNIAVPIDDENGDPLADRVVNIAALALLPTPLEWQLSRELQGVLNPLRIVTLKLQAAQMTPDNAWLLIVKAYAFYANPALTVDVPNPVTKPDDELSYTTTPLPSLQPSTQLVVQLMKEQMYARFMSKGPTKPELLCLRLNPALNLAQVLSPSQVGSSSTLLYEEIVRVDELRRSREALVVSHQDESSAASSSTSALAQQRLVVPSVSSSGMFDMDDFMKPLEIDAAENTSLNELGAECDAFNAISRADLAFGVVGGKFEPLVFWANSAVETKFPRHSAVARSFYAGRGSEDTCERTFSFATRILSSLRGNMDPEQVSASVSNQAAVKHYKISAEEVWEEYQTKAAQKAEKRTRAEM